MGERGTQSMVKACMHRLGCAVTPYIVVDGWGAQCMRAIKASCGRGLCSGTGARNSESLGEQDEMRGSSVSVEGKAGPLQRYSAFDTPYVLQSIRLGKIKSSERWLKILLEKLQGTEREKTVPSIAPKTNVSQQQYQMNVKKKLAWVARELCYKHSHEELQLAERVIDYLFDAFDFVQTNPSEARILLFGLLQQQIELSVREQREDSKRERHEESVEMSSKSSGNGARRRGDSPHHQRKRRYDPETSRLENENSSGDKHVQTMMNVARTYDKMKRLGLHRAFDSFSSLCLSDLIILCSQENHLDVRKGKEIYADLKVEGLAPTTTATRHLIRGLYWDGDRAAAKALFTEVNSKPPFDMGIGCYSDLYTACRIHGFHDDAVYFASLMEEWFEVNRSTSSRLPYTLYSSLIEAKCDLGKFDSAKEVFNQMCENEDPERFYYSSGYHLGMAEEKKDLLLPCRVGRKARFICPVRIMVRRFLDQGLKEEVLDVLEKAEIFGKTLPSSTLRVILFLLTKILALAPDENQTEICVRIARNFFHYLGDRASSRDFGNATFTLRAVLQSQIKNGDLEKAIALFRTIQDEGFGDSPDILGVMLVAVERERLFLNVGSAPPVS